MDGWSLEDSAIWGFPGLWRELVVRLFNAVMSGNAHDTEVGFLIATLGHAFCG